MILACLDGAEVSASGWVSGGPRFQSHPRLTFQSCSRYQLNQLGSEAASESTFKKSNTCGVSNTRLHWFFTILWVMQLNRLYSFGIYARWYHWTCGRTQRKAATINQLACPSYSRSCMPQLQPLCSAALVPDVLPRRDEGSGSTWIEY